MIASAPLPDGALLSRYATRGYTDCFITEIPGKVTLAQYVEAFYTTPIFRLERLILRWLASRPSTDADVTRLATGSSDQFAAWTVEERGDDQLLLADFRGHTRSWLMVLDIGKPDAAAMRLYFGSAVLARPGNEPGDLAPGAGYRALLGFHRIYSRVLLRAARSRLLAGRSADAPPGSRQ